MNIHFSFPWNQSTYLGYFAEICMTIRIAYGYLTLNGTSLLLFISSCIQHREFSKMFKYSIVHQRNTMPSYYAAWFDFIFQPKGKTIPPFLKKKSIVSFVCFHCVHSFSWFLKSAHVYRSFILAQLICNTVVMMISVFYFDLVCKWNADDWIWNWLKDFHFSNRNNLISLWPV